MNLNDDNPSAVHPDFQPIPSDATPSNTSPSPDDPSPDDRYHLSGSEMPKEDLELAIENDAILSEFSDMVGRKSKPGYAILASLTPEKCHLWHMASCIQGEAGELFDGIKKYLIYNKPLTQDVLDNILEEMGDIMFYMQGLLHGLNSFVDEPVDLVDILLGNIIKLDKRYADKYTDQEAQARADKQPDVEEVNRQLSVYDPTTEND